MIKNQLNLLILGTAVLSMGLLSTCSGERNEDAAYSSGYDASSLITLEQGEGYPPLKFPVNQAIVYTEDGVVHKDMVALIESLDDVKLIGQAPGSGIYQLEVNSTTREELDEIIEQLRDFEGIQGATYNFLVELASDVGSCPVEPDVGIFSQPLEYTLPYYQNQYLTALEIMQGIPGDVPIHPVTIGIVERGYSDNQEFDDVSIENASEQDEHGIQLPLDTTDDHGTRVAGIICGDNDGMGINGLASTLIGGNLRVVMAHVNGDSQMNVITAMENAITVGRANIVNTSWIHGPFAEPTAEYARGVVLSYTQLMNRYRDVLFVNAAGNNGIELTGNNAAPGGIALANSLTVSAWHHDSRAVRGDRFNFGEVVDISAPGEEIPTVGANGTIEFKSGTSLAAPMVTSAAALLKAVGGSSLSPVDIKLLLTTPTYHADRTEPGGGIQLSFSHPLVDLLWDLYQDTEWAQELLAGPDGDHHIPPELVKTRICQDTWIEVDEFGNFLWNDYAECRPKTSAVMAPDGSRFIKVSVLNLSNTSGDTLALSMTNTAMSSFALNTPFSIASETVKVSIFADHLYNNYCESVDPQDGDFDYVGGCTSGTYEITNCRVSERTADGRAKYLFIDLRIQGAFRGAHTTFWPSDPLLPIDIEEMTTNLIGEINDVLVITLDPFGTFSEDVDEVCNGEAEGVTTAISQR